jgi:hypothetical protein
MGHFINKGNQFLYVHDNGKCYNGEDMRQEYDPKTFKPIEPTEPLPEAIKPEPADISGSNMIIGLTRAKMWRMSLSELRKIAKSNRGTKAQLIDYIAEHNR